jgi:DNA gyrase subunit B
MRAGQSRATFIDCAVHGAGSGAELFIVEGESAAASVAAVRSARFQAVLPLQGKPMNAWRASADKVRAHALYQQLADALGLPDATSLSQGTPEVMAAAAATLRFERLVLLFDPDADGIHIGALVLLYLQRWAPVLIEQGRVAMARAPMFVVGPGVADAAPLLAYRPKERQQLVDSVMQTTGVAPRVQAVRGLGSLPPPLLAAEAVDPTTRKLRIVNAAEVAMVIEVFGGLGA